MKNGPSIVIVEEACLSRNVLVKALRTWGYECAVAESGEHAWQALREAAAPRLVLADWHADFLDCEEFFEQLRADAELRDAFVMGGVPRGALGAIRRCAAAGADDVVARPYDLDEVRLRLHNASRLMGLAPKEAAFPDE